MERLPKETTLSLQAGAPGAEGGAVGEAWNTSGGGIRADKSQALEGGRKQFQDK